MVVGMELYGYGALVIIVHWQFWGKKPQGVFAQFFVLLLMRMYLLQLMRTVCQRYCCESKADKKFVQASSNYELKIDHLFNFFRYPHALIDSIRFGLPMFW